MGEDITLEQAKHGIRMTDREPELFKTKAAAKARLVEIKRELEEQGYSVSGSAATGYVARRGEDDFCPIGVVLDSRGT